MQEYQLTIIGVGPGSMESLTYEAMSAIQEAPILYTARRHAVLAGVHRTTKPLEPLANVIENIKEDLKQSNVAVLVSGDPTLFSIAKVLRKHVHHTIRFIAGISSIQALFCALGESMDDVHIFSVHGKVMFEANVIAQVKRNQAVAYLTDAETNPSRICQVLTHYDLGEVDVAIGENLTYPNQRVVKGKAKEYCDEVWQQNSVIRIRNDQAKLAPVVPTLHDDEFLRGDVPMTKEEIRMLALCKMGITRDAIVWDAGAGTGSIAIQSAQLANQGHVFAIEREFVAVELIEKNIQHFQCPNITVIHGVMPDCLKTLPDPTHVFIGGSGGKIENIISEISERGSGIHIVVTAITLDTMKEAENILRGTNFHQYEMIQVQINKQSDRANMLLAQNPIFIIRAKTGKEQ